MQIIRIYEGLDMKYFLQDKDNIIISHSNIEVLDKEIKNIEISEADYQMYLETPERLYILNHNLYIMTDTEWEKYLEEQEKERILNLKCTKRVLALCLQQLGISYTQLKELIATNEQAQLEWDLCVELERSNPLLDIMGQQLGLSPEQIDNIFKFANGEIESLEV